MSVHVKRRHGKYLAMNGYSPGQDYLQTYGSSPYGFKHNTHFRQTAPYAEIPAKKETSFQDQVFENLRKYNDGVRTIDGLSSREESRVQIDSILLASIQAMILSQNRRALDITKIPAGYRMFVCDKCMPAGRLEAIGDFSHLVFEGLTKPTHVCDPKSVAAGLSEMYSSNTKSQIHDLLIRKLFEFIDGRIGQGDALLKVLEIPVMIFTEEGRREVKMNPGKPLIEEKDTIKIDLAQENLLRHWSYRVIQNFDNDDHKAVKISRNEMKEFINTTKSTFGVFQFNLNNLEKKSYFLMYLVF